ncbi:tripartite tricarboxylate transporter TctB family protein [Celeribacter litoreus]|uniref:tripartite tricarboxylate transporter TctB family protein n=1 Tax=Celeribacter litoreus TaxID=2876714 RepID=UPI001CCF90C0|nr:tripartite tricarboxylate transporter TctB family protein [Celeribacter litoreus]MCA0044907.1 tripartite tricarboxylate transporter TctB family protein [Celeribacter litoreus]
MNHEHVHDESHEGHADAQPGGLASERRPGELAFTIVLVAFSGFLLWEAYGISGFEALSGPGAIPMATTFVMLVSAVILLFKAARLKLTADETFMVDITPPLVLVLAAFLVVYGLLLKPLGFLPTSALFLVASIKILARRSWGFTITVGLGSLLLIYLIFRIVFSVLIPAGIIPEAEIIQFFRNLFAGGA